MNSVTQSVRAIPPHKRGPKIVRTIFGALVFVGALFLPKYLGIPWQAAMAVAAFGGFTMSQELVIAFAKVVPAAVAAFMRGLSGKNGDAPPS